MPSNSLPEVLAAAAAVLGRPIAAEDTFFAVGGDSVAAVELARELELRLGGDVDDEAILDSRDFRSLATMLAMRVPPA